MGSGACGGCAPMRGATPIQRAGVCGRAGLAPYLSADCLNRSLWLICVLVTLC